MDKKKSLDLIKLEVLGCLTEQDKEKIQAMKDEGEGFPWKELGDYQNLIAILPVTLELKYPGKDLKDKTATMLFNMRDQIQAKIDAKKAKEMPVEMPVAESVELEEGINIDEQVEESVTTEEIEIEEKEFAEVEEGISLSEVEKASIKNEPVRFTGNFKGKSEPEISSLRSEELDIKELEPKEFEPKEPAKTVSEKDAFEKTARDYMKNLERELNSLRSTVSKNKILTFILFAVAIILMIAMYFIK
jgi:hypothetical protein